MDLSSMHKDIAELGTSLAQGLEAQVFGSFSARNPGLGKMMRCPFCHTRRYQFASSPCCNAGHAKTQRAWDPEQGFYQVECAPRANESPFSKSVIKKMLHKRHGQNKNWHRRMLTTLLQAEPWRVEAAARQMYWKPKRGYAEIRKMLPDTAGIPAFAEQYFDWLSAQERRRQRGQQ